MKRLKSLLNHFKPNHMEKRERTVEHIACIEHSSEAVGWRPVTYQLPERFSGFIDNLESDIEYELEMNPDLFNEDYYSGKVDAEERIALMNLYAQMTDHNWSIHSIRLYQEASREAVLGRIRQLETVFNQNKEVIE